MIKRLLKIDDCHFSFPDRDGNYYPIDIKNGKAYCCGCWKEVKLYNDGSTDLINVCEMLVDYALKQNPSCKGTVYEMAV